MSENAAETKRADPRATDVSPVAGDDLEKGSIVLVVLGFVFFAAVTAVGIIFFLLGQDDPANEADYSRAAACGTMSHQEYSNAIDLCGGDSTCEDQLPHYWNSAAGCVYFPGALTPPSLPPLHCRSALEGG